MAGYNDQSDESLMSLVLNGDKQAFSTLVHRHTGLFFSAAFRMCGHAEEAEDIVQEAFLKLWERPASYDHTRGAKFTTWFYRVVTNLAIDKTRSRKPYANVEVLEKIADTKAPQDVLIIDHDEGEAVERAIQALPERQKIALNLCFYEGLSNKEAAEIMGVKVKALESLLMRAKGTLREKLSQAGLVSKGNEKGKVHHAK